MRVVLSPSSQQFESSELSLTGNFALTKKGRHLSPFVAARLVLRGGPQVAPLAAHTFFLQTAGRLASDLRELITIGLLQTLLQTHTFQAQKVSSNGRAEAPQELPFDLFPFGLLFPWGGNCSCCFILLLSYNNWTLLFVLYFSLSLRFVCRPPANEQAIATN